MKKNQDKPTCKRNGCQLKSFYAAYLARNKTPHLKLELNTFAMNVFYLDKEKSHVNAYSTHCHYHAIRLDFALFI